MNVCVCVRECTCVYVRVYECLYVRARRIVKDRRRETDKYNYMGNSGLQLLSKELDSGD